MQLLQRNGVTEKVWSLWQKAHAITGLQRNVPTRKWVAHVVQKRTSLWNEMLRFISNVHVLKYAKVHIWTFNNSPKRHEFNVTAFYRSFLLATKNSLPFHLPPSHLLANGFHVWIETKRQNIMSTLNDQRSKHIYFQIQWKTKNHFINGQINLNTAKISLRFNDVLFNTLPNGFSFWFAC